MVTNEEELLYLMNDGCEVARQYLYKWCYQCVENNVKKISLYNHANLDQNDIIQNAWSACINALSCYRQDQSCRLKTYLNKVIKNRIASLIKKMCLEKERFYDRSISFDDVTNVGYCYSEVVTTTYDYAQPENSLHVKETKTQYEHIIDHQCSKLEKAVIRYHNLGYHAHEIADILNVKPKTVYNAMYRIQKKLVVVK